MGGDKIYFMISTMVASVAATFGYGGTGGGLKAFEALCLILFSSLITSIQNPARSKNMPLVSVVLCMAFRFTSTVFMYCVMALTSASTQVTMSALVIAVTV